MAHPFFDASVYPWERPEAALLHRELSKAVYAVARIDLIYQQCAPNLPPLSLVQPPDVIWKEALQNLTSRGALQKLCEHVLGDNNLKSIHDFVRDVVNAQPAIEMRIIRDGVHETLVLDRVTLREKLALLEPDATPVKVLLVRGGPQSGKSHGRYLFERAARDQGALALYLYEGIVATVDEVVMQLFSALEALDEIPARLTTEDAWYKLVCIKLQTAALSKQRRLWIAVDDLGLTSDGAPLLDTEIRKFFDQFALNMLNPVFRQWFRLMLIHYPDGPIPTKWKQDFWTEDHTSEADVLQKDVEELLESWLVAHDRKIIEDELTDLAGKVIAKAEAPVEPDQDKAPRLRRIHDELTKTLKDLARR